MAKSKPTAKQDQRKSKSSDVRTMPLFALRDIVMFPGQSLTLNGVEKLPAPILQRAQQGQLQIAVFTSRAEAMDHPATSLAPVGVVARVTKSARLPNGQFVFEATALARCVCLGVQRHGQNTTGDVKLVKDRPYNRTEQVMARFQSLKKDAVKMAEASPSMPDPIRARLRHSTDPAELTLTVASQLSVDLEERLRLLEMFSVPNRLKRLGSLAAKEWQYMILAGDIQSQVETRITDLQRRNYIAQQIDVLKKELGEGDDDRPLTDLEELEQDLDDIALPEAVRETVDRELDRLEMISPGSPEYIVAFTYLSWIRDLPWPADEQGEDALPLPDVSSAAKQLDRDHYGLDKVKERILEYLAVVRHRGHHRGEILLLAGPPGVGKTSLARSVATALDRPFVRIPLGGVKDQAEIRGHRRTYIGAMPGKIVQGLKQAGTVAPVMLLDELDKVGADHGRHDLESALLEVLDYEQNSNFIDHYLGVPYDLSQVLFIATANSVDELSEPLRDRLEIVELPSYTEFEKERIARKHLLPHARKELRLKAAQFNLKPAAVRQLIRDYTREAGVRQLRREIQALGRKAVKAHVEGKAPLNLAADGLAEFLGKPRFISDPNESNLPPGVAIGLAYTSVGGEILYIEASKTARADGKGGQVHLTGRLGQVMKESAQAASSFLASFVQDPSHAEALGFTTQDIESSQVHLHFPDGATPKDGPSAGVAILSTLASLFAGRSLPAKIAMTGEITLRGQVLPVGGIREKLLAAHRYGKTRILIPQANVRDLDDLPATVRNALDITPVATMAEVLAEVGLLRSKSKQDSPEKDSPPRRRRSGASQHPFPERSPGHRDRPVPL